MSAITPGQAAQEASAAILRDRFGMSVLPSDEATADVRDGWETIAQAAINADRGGCPCGCQSATRTRLRDLLAEILTAPEVVAYAPPVSLAEWRQRAGLEAP